MDPLSLEIPEQLQTPRLRLRRYRQGDGAEYFQTLRANHAHLLEFLPPELLSLQNESDAEKWIRQLIEAWQMRRLLLFGIWFKETGAYIGETYLANADWRVPCIELGYFLSKESTGKGLATEAANRVIRFAFEHLRVVRIELQCAADNQASIGVAERCGFRLEGRLRQRSAKKDGARVDRLWYGLLLSEWQTALDRE